MPVVEVLKFGSSVLRSAADLPVAVDEIYRRWRAGYQVLVVVSAFEGVTDQLINEASALFGSSCPEATAVYVATGEQRTAALLTGRLGRSGIPARVVEPREIGLIAVGSILESAPVQVDTTALQELWRAYPILVLPGFYGIDAQGRTALFGRGGSDLSALFLAAELEGSCRLLKDVRGVFDADPASSRAAHRFSSLSWTRAIEVAGPLIQSKALRYAQARGLAFEVGRPNEVACTAVGQTHDQWAPPMRPYQPLRIVLLGCGVVGRGVYQAVKRYPDRFRICQVVVRDVAMHTGVDELTTDFSVALEPSVDVIIECFGGLQPATDLMASALAQGKVVITANKAAVAAGWTTLSEYARAEKRRLWYSAAIGGALPAIETLGTLRVPVCEIRGIINGTCGVVLDAWAAGKTCNDAIAMAQAGGFAEADPGRDLSGCDSADKLALLIEAAFGGWHDPADIPTCGLDTIKGDPGGFKLIARARREGHGIAASVSPELPSPDSFLGRASGPENRLEIELTNGEVIRLRAQGAGRCPTAVSILGDLHEVARLAECGLIDPWTRRRSGPRASLMG